MKRTKKKSTRREYPLYSYYASLPSVKLTREQARDATFDERFASIGRYLARQAGLFHHSLSAEGKVSHDPDDICSELWIELREKNGSYNWEEGSYLAFASPVIRHKLIWLRETSRVVKMPMNANVSFSEAEQAEQEGTLSKTKRITLACIRAAATDHMPLVSTSRHAEHAPDAVEFQPIDESMQPLEELETEESEEACVGDLSRNLLTLTLLEAVVLGASLGLWGSDKRTLGQVSLQYGHDPKHLATVLREARRKLGISAKLK